MPLLNKALYDIDHMTDDLAGLLDALKIEKAVFCGHDWGGWLVWAMGQLKPERVSGVISVSTPLRPQPPALPQPRFREPHPWEEIVLALFSFR